MVKIVWQISVPILPHGSLSKEILGKNFDKEMNVICHPGIVTFVCHVIDVTQQHIHMMMSWWPLGCDSMDIW